MNPDRIEIQHTGAIEVPRDKAGRIRWSALRSDPESLALVVETEAQVFLADGTQFSEKNLRSAGMFSLLNAVRRYYPGGLNALGERLGVTPDRHPRGYWRGLEAVEVIKQEAAAFYQVEGSLTQTLLAQRGRADLTNAIRLYPGGIRQLKTDLDIAVTKKPDGYWTIDQIRADARDVLQTEGRLVPNFLSKLGRGNLRSAITQQYPGGWKQLRTDLETDPLRKPNGYWTPERIREEVFTFCQSHGDVREPLLRQNGRADIVGAIRNYYPGHWTQLRKDLGLRVLRFNWTPEIIEQEARGFYQTEGKLTYVFLEQQRHSGLRAAIRKRYPGGMRALKQKLGIGIENILVGISPEEANEQLRKLLEEQV